MHDTVHALENLGFIVRMRAVPCIPIHKTPNGVPYWNAWNRAQYQEKYRQLTRMSGKEIAALDWSLVDESLTAESLSRTGAWACADVDGARAVPSGSSHHLDEESYPPAQEIPGPLMVFYDPSSPDVIPQAALDSAKENASLWAWTVGLSPRYVHVFRAKGEGFEIVTKAR
jgi:hypothetical protein